MIDAPLLTTLMRVVAGGAVDGHGVGRAVAAPLPGVADRSMRDLRDAGAGQVVDGDGVGAAERVEAGCARRR